MNKDFEKFLLQKKEAKVNLPEGIVEDKGYAIQVSPEFFQANLMDFCANKSPNKRPSGDYKYMAKKDGFKFFCIIPKKLK